MLKIKRIKTLIGLQRVEDLSGRFWFTIETEVPDEEACNGDDYDFFMEAFDHMMGMEPLGYGNTQHNTRNDPDRPNPFGGDDWMSDQVFSSLWTKYSSSIYNQNI